MADDVSFTNTYMAYWQNNPYIYPQVNANQETIPAGGINTGWHILPLMLWKHFASPKQWAEMVINYEAYTVKGFSCTVFNPVPMTQQLAIQGTSTFTAFNNTIYSMGCSDELYETSWHNWWTDTDPFNQFIIAYKEGHYRTNLGTSATWRRTMLPIYEWRAARYQTQTDVTWSWNWTNLSGNGVWPRRGYVAPDNPISDSYKESFNSPVPSGVYWDPFTNSDDIMELRPGKNSMTWSWNVHPCDEGKWFNLDRMYSYWPLKPDSPWTALNRSGPTGAYVQVNMDDPTPILTPGTYLSASSSTTAMQRDVTVPDMSELPIVPCYWIWQEMTKSIAEQDHPGQVLWDAPGTEWEQYKYPPKQCLIKGLPLFDDDGNHILTTTQGCFKVTLNIACKKRRSKIYAPTWFPWGWTVSHTINGGMLESYARYRTAGARRTWTNVAARNNVIPNVGNIHRRDDPYPSSQTYTTGITGNVRATSTYTTANIDSKTQTK
nr:MAG: VP1 [Canine parvovirus]